MTYRERAKEATWEAGCPDWGSDDQECLETAVERAINAAVEDDRKTRQHVFVGSLDRWCEVCGEPDRDARHVYTRESVRASVEIEREECAKILDNADVESYCGFQIAELARLIRARVTASDGGTK